MPTLGNLGKTIELRKPPARPAAGTLQELAQAIDKGEVETLVILGGNPVYTAPADLDLADLIKKVATTIRLGLHADETSAAGDLAPARGSLPGVVGRRPRRGRDRRCRSSR